MLSRDRTARRKNKDTISTITMHGRYEFVIKLNYAKRAYELVLVI